MIKVRKNGQWVEVSGSEMPSTYLKSITKDEANKTITIKDEKDTSTSFSYGGQIDSKTIFDICNPVGSIKIFDKEVDMSKLSNGTWELIPDDTFIASKGITSAGQIGGSNDAVVIEHTHTGEAVDKYLRLEGGEHYHTIFSHNAWDEANCGLGHEDARSGVCGSKGPEHTHSYYHTDILGHQIIDNATHTHEFTHKHSLNLSTDGVSGTNKNMPKYLATYIYKRTA